MAESNNALVLPIESSEGGDDEVEFAFQTQAVEGLLAFEHFEIVLRAMGIDISDQDLMSACLGVFGSDRVEDLKADGLMLDDVAELVRYLKPDGAQGTYSKDDEGPHDECDPHKDHGYAQRFQHWCRATAQMFRKCKNWIVEFASGIKPTNRLVIVVTVISFLMATGVAGLAIGLNWVHAIQAQNDALSEQSDLVLRAIEDFGWRQLHEHYDENLQQTANIVSKLISEIGFNANVHSTNLTKLHGVRTTTLMIDHLLDTTIAHWLQNQAETSALMLNQLCLANLPAFDVVQYVNALNSGALGLAKKGHEMVLIQNGSITTTLSFASQCPSLGCNTSLLTSNEAFRTSGFSSGSFRGQDYAGRDISAGFSQLNAQCGSGWLVYMVRQVMLQQRFLNETVTAANAANVELGDDPIEILVQPTTPLGSIATLPKHTPDCPTFNTCRSDVAALLAEREAMVHDYGSAINRTYYGSEMVLAVASTFTFFPAVLTFEVRLSDLHSWVLNSLGEAARVVNANLLGTSEIMFGRPIQGSGNYSTLGPLKFAAECPRNGCGADPAMMNAAVKTQSGFGSFIDYRGQDVIAAFRWIPELGAGMVLKVDESEISANILDHSTQYANEQNKQDTEASNEILLGIMVNGQPSLLTELKYPPQGDSDTQNARRRATQFDPLLKGIQGQHGETIETDYRGKKVMVAYRGTHGMGVVFKIDESEVTRPMVIELVIVFFSAIGIVIVGNLFLGVVSHRMLGSIEDTWEKSRLAVQEQKEHFELLLAALYPKFVTDRLVAGESQIFLELPQATVFFSDICNFTSISNRLTAHELLQWIGYTFGVMDQVANYYHIYKIKTIGDAYLAVAGLPGLVSDKDPDTHSLRMLQFASACVQVFSGRYTHPDAGACLEMIASHNALLRQEKKDARAVTKKKRGSDTGLSIVASSIVPSPRTAGGDQHSNKSRCNMRYGIAAGPLTCGVLQGKCPAFDVWGKTVNLACRMESTSQPNCIHCTESVYLAVMQVPDQPFEFDKPSSTFAKGFGNVSAYFVKASDEQPPKSLLTQLAIEPCLGKFQFELSHSSKMNGTTSKGPLTTEASVLGPTASLAGGSTVPAYFNKDDVVGGEPASLGLRRKDPQFGSFRNLRPQQIGTIPSSPKMASQGGWTHSNTFPSAAGLPRPADMANAAETVAVTGKESRTLVVSLSENEMEQ